MTWDIPATSGSPASPVNCAFTYAEAAVKFQNQGGADPGLISTNAGQHIAEFATKAHNEILRWMFGEGYTVAQVSSWLTTGDGKAVSMELAACFWSIDKDGYNDPTYGERHDKLCENWEEVKAGRPLFDTSGDLIEPDRSTAAASVLQGEDTTRNAQDAGEHDYVFDWNQFQFAGNLAGRIAAGVRYTNEYRDD